jgi:hypothetical protein
VQSNPDQRKDNHSQPGLMTRRHEKIGSGCNPEKTLYDEHINQGIANGVQQQ